MTFYSVQPLPDYTCRLFDDASRLEGVQVMTDEEYNEAPGMRATAVKDACLMSPYKWRHKWVHGYQDAEDKDVYIFGRGFHALTADPTQEMFNQQFVVLPPTVVRKGNPNARKAENKLDKVIAVTMATPEIQPLLKRAKAEGKSVIKQEEYHKAVDMANSLHRYPWFREWIDHRDCKLEICTFRYHEPSGLWLKAKLDLYIPGTVIADWKSTVAADPWPFALQAGKLKYHVQAAHYAFCVNMDTSAFRLVAGEKTAPYEWTNNTLSWPAIDEGERRFETVLDELSNCYHADVWPGLRGDELNPPAHTL